MQQQWSMILQGYVIAEVKGQHVEKLINILLENRISIWDIRRLDNTSIKLSISIQNYFRLRPYLRQTNCRIHVLSRHGFPFILNKLEARKYFAVGFIIFLIGLYMLSSIIWQVNVIGNERIATHEILDAARKQGLYPFQWKFKLKDPDYLSTELTKELSGTSWIGVEIVGSKIQIEVVESKLSEERPLLSPRHLISKSDAVITNIQADKGKPVVKVNQHVKKGDILISGELGDEEFREIVIAQGIVTGLVWHHYEIEVPVTQQYKTYTGDSKNKRYLIIGNRALQITGYGEMKFERHENIIHRNDLIVGRYKLPLGWMKETIMEVQLQENELEVETARSLGLEQAKSDILLQLDEEAHIIDQKVLHEKIENGKVYMKVLFEAEQIISDELPIIQGD